MKSLLYFSLFILLVPFSSSCQSQTNTAASPLVWYTDFEAARKVSDANHVPIFALFTGSDWCGWCKKLQADVISKPAFIEWAKKNVVLLELDFPRRKQLEPALAQQNQALQNAFKVTGYPTVWIFNVAPNEGNTGLNLAALGSTGYPQGAEIGKEEFKFLENVNAFLQPAKH